MSDINQEIRSVRQLLMEAVSLGDSAEALRLAKKWVVMGDRWETKYERITVEIPDSGKDWPKAISDAIAEHEVDGWQRHDQIPQPESSEYQGKKFCFIFNIRFDRKRDK